MLAAHELSVGLGDPRFGRMCRNRGVPGTIPAIAANADRGDRQANAA